MDENHGRREVMQQALENRVRIWGFLMGLVKNPQQAEDLFQNTYLVICEKWRQYRHGTNFLAWALQIARYEFLKSVDSGRRTLVLVETEVLESAIRATASKPETFPSKREALGRCLGILRGRSKRAVELRYAQGLSCAAAARKLELSLNALYTLLSRARKVLKECVERRIQSAEV